ncbi:hypothetical protein FHS29_007336 [Saccharothrix tamanrassetensis]|uniref:CHAT domain-containing protein n=1 Tax=Saccharothrix tamanrassetensis TaxID=1051531 RepID=A0A841CX53_9PSEU|nr:CHAT domain-containing protein [Saccharothrix tamanrassetensis]MBB5960708.1 hypothetical protein [Saccharothrix tamanrassetensis]
MTDLLDEAIHLLAAFQLAGYPHVAGTLWEINDPIAADIAEAIYAHLTTDGRPILPGRRSRFTTPCGQPATSCPSPRRCGPRTSTPDGAE